MHGKTVVALIAFAALVCLQGVVALPTPKQSPPAATAALPVPPAASTASTNASGAPRFMVYTDQTTADGPAPDPSKITGFNTVAMSFLLSTGAADMALAWQQLPETQRQTIKSNYHKAGIKLIVSAFGSTELPTTNGKDPKTLAATMAQWVKDNDVDGIDVDYEDLPAMTASDGKAEQWLIDFTTALRQALPQGQYILSHAPLAPWFSKTAYESGAYLTVDRKVGTMIDWYNVQFYNQGAQYTTCNSLLNKSTGPFPGTSVFEIGAAGIPLDKIVIGKPGAANDAHSGYMDPATLAGCVNTAVGQKWNAGIMSFRYPAANAAWIQTAKGSAFN